MKTILILIAAIIAVNASVRAQQQQLPDFPPFVWSYEYWENANPVTPSSPLTKQQSGEDWPFKIIQDGTSFAVCGYSREFITTVGQDCNATTFDDEHLKTATIFKLESDGTVDWKKRFSTQSTKYDLVSAEFNSMMLTSDNHYVAVGFTYKRGEHPFNPTSTNPSPAPLPNPGGTTVIDCFYDPNNGGNHDTPHDMKYYNIKRQIYVVKTKNTEEEGSVSGWPTEGYTYNSVGIADYESEPCDNFEAEAWDVVELENGNYLVVGYAPDPEYDSEDPVANVNRQNIDSRQKPHAGATYPDYWATNRVFMMEIDKDNGQQVWIETYRPEEMSGAGTAFAVRKRPGNNDYVLMGRLLDQKAWNRSLTNKSYSDVFISTFSTTGGSAPTLDNTLIMNHDFYFPIGNNINHRATDIAFSNNGQHVYVPVAMNCYGCQDWTGKASGIVFKIPFDDIAPDYEAEYHTYPPFDIEAFDLKIGITPVSDNGTYTNGFAIVTSHRKTEILDHYQAGKALVDPYHAKMNTDTYIAKYDENCQPVDCLSFDAGTDHGLCPLDWKRQECMYSILEVIEDDEPYYVVCGNSSSNGDDHYVVKTSLECPTTSTTGYDRTLPNDKPASAPDVGGTDYLAYHKVENPTNNEYVAAPAANTTIKVIAGNRIVLKPGFHAKPVNSGSKVHLYIRETKCGCE
jgi:hypothetical protein